jgi:hypothetical protein
MPAWHFETHLNPNHTVTVPPNVAAQLGLEATVHVVLMTADAIENANWQRLATEQFFQGYAPGDDIYDQLSAG